MGFLVEVWKYDKISWGDNYAELLTPFFTAYPFGRSATWAVIAMLPHGMFRLSGLRP